MIATTNGDTQTCDKCRKLIRGEEVNRFTLVTPKPDSLASAWIDHAGQWVNQFCPNCTLALRLEGKL